MIPHNPGAKNHASKDTETQPPAVDIARQILTGAPLADEFDRDNILATLRIHTMQNNTPVIPLLGDLALAYGGNPKRPALPSWTEYQNRLPTPTEWREWDNKGYSAYGAIMGRFSNRAALDFDRPEVEAEFIVGFPELLDTYTERSPGIDHAPANRLIYRWPAEADIRTRGHKGSVELLGEGSYYVCAPSRIAGKQYTVIRGGAPLALTVEQAEQIIDFVERHKPAPEPALALTLLTHASAAIEPNYWHNIYHRIAQQTGSRNKGAFLAGCQMRNHGLPDANTIDTLAHVFIHDPAPPTHRYETKRQRLDELISTIRSVYSKPALTRLAIAMDMPGLPTNVREQLLQRKLGSLARVLDALLILGKEPGCMLTEKSVLELLQPLGIAGRRAVAAALTAEIEGKVTFVRSRHSNREQGQHNAYVSVSPPHKTPKHRPAVEYLMPELAAVCELLGVEASSSDPLTLADLVNDNTYKQAITRGLFARRPGEYTQSFLARRIGVTRPTLNKRLRRDDKIVKTPRTKRQELNLHTVEQHIAEDDGKPFFRGGVWLEIVGSGLKYPPRRVVAFKLLKAGHKIVLVRNMASHYALPAAEVVADENLIKPEISLARAREEESQQFSTSEGESVATTSAEPIHQNPPKPTDFVPAARGVAPKGFKQIKSIKPAV